MSNFYLKLPAYLYIFLLSHVVGKTNVADHLATPCSTQNFQKIKKFPVKVTSD